MTSIVEIRDNIGKRREWESSNQFQLRQRFVKHLLQTEYGMGSIEDLQEPADIERVAKLAEAFYNVKFLHSVYANDTMKIIRDFDCNGA